MLRLLVSLGICLLHATFSRVIGMMIESGIEPPIFKSANLDGSYST